jgi:hypothetical protein
MEIKLSLTIEEVNGVLQALGNMAYAQVAPLIDKIRSQAGPQVEAAQQPAEAPAETPEEKK